MFCQCFSRAYDSFVGHARSHDNRIVYGNVMLCLVPVWASLLKTLSFNLLGLKLAVHSCILKSETIVTADHWLDFCRGHNIRNLGPRLLFRESYFRIRVDHLWKSKDQVQMAAPAKTTEKEPVNIVHQNAILCETIKKENQCQRLYTNYGVNPFKKSKLVCLCWASLGLGL